MTTGIYCEQHTAESAGCVLQSNASKGCLLAKGSCYDCLSAAICHSSFFLQGHVVRPTDMFAMYAMQGHADRPAHRVCRR